MAHDGVSGEVLYPSFPLDQYSITDAKLQEACFRVYNDWLLDYCSTAPDRLFGIAMISVYDIDHAVQELGRCKSAGMVGGLIWQVPPAGYEFTSDHYEPLWAASQELDMPINVHILTGEPYPHQPPRNRPPRTSNVPSFRDRVNTKILYASNTLGDFLASGALERYPGLKFVIVENEVSWLPFFVTKFDEYARRAGKDWPMPMLPSEYFERQVYATFFNDPAAAWFLPSWGADNCMWSNDYPHPNSTWPNSREVIARDLGHLPLESRAKLVRENVARLYNLPVLNPVAAN
jgi:predicted TIM-barrel fold metal-dependent hydrolase